MKSLTVTAEEIRAARQGKAMDRVELSVLAGVSYHLIAKLETQPTSRTSVRSHGLNRVLYVLGILDDSDYEDLIKDVDQEAERIIAEAAKRESLLKEEKAALLAVRDRLST